MAVPQLAPDDQAARDTYVAERDTRTAAPTPPPYVPGSEGISHGIPEADKAEYWKIGDSYYVVYFVPDQSPPIPMAWETDMEELKAIWGPGVTKPINKTISEDQAKAMGVTHWGKANELDPNSEHPFDAYVSMISDQAKVRPWLRDTEVLALIAQASLEGRQITTAEFQQTEWYSSKTDAERKWLLQYESDPQTAQQMLSDRRYQVEQDLWENGINTLDPQVINYMADQVTTGIWSQAYYDRQLKAVSDPSLGYPVDKELLNLVGGQLDIGTNQQYEDVVIEEAIKWLGPQFGQLSPEDVTRWASRFRNSPDAAAEFEAEMKRQRLALFPEYDDPSLSYNDIAMPWRAKVNQLWGQTADEMDPLFTKIIRMNDATEAGRLLTTEGLKRGVKKVEQNAQSAMDAAFNSQAGVLATPR